MSFSKDKEVQSSAAFGLFVASLAQNPAMQGKLNITEIKALLGDDANGRTNEEVRHAVQNMCTSFPKAP